MGVDDEQKPEEENVTPLKEENKEEEGENAIPKADENKEETINPVNEITPTKKEGDEKKMGKTNRKPGRPTKQDNNTKLSFNDLKEEFDDMLFEGTIAYLNIQKQYKETPKEEYMSITEFEAKVNEFKNEKIYKKEATQAEAGDS